MADRLISVPAARSHIDATVADPILKACMHNVLDGLPAADAVPVVHGRWIEKVDMVSSYLSGCEELFAECSVCHAAEVMGSNYCPNCGAKMDL